MSSSILLQGDVYRQWQAPPAEAREDTKLGWLAEQNQDGNAWQRSQRGYLDYSKALDIISGTFSESELLQYRSMVTSNRLKTNIRVAVAGLSAIRPWGGYQATNEFSAYALMMNTCTRALYLEGFWDQDIKAALQWCAATCTGFIRPVYRRDMAGQGHGQIELDTFGMPSVLPVQMPPNGDYNRAYAVTLMDEKPIWEAHGMFPDYQDRLKPTTSKYWHNSSIRRAATDNMRKRSWWNPFRTSKGAEISDNLIPFRYTRINDLAINATGKSMAMGEPGSSWYYEVPSFGTEIDAGFDEKGNRMYRKATAHDARIYPFGRLMISSESAVCYDGPGFNWHGQLDLIPFCLDRWPWEPMGFSMVHDGYSIQHSIDKIDRGTMDKIVADLDRPLAYNMNAVSKREAMQVDLMQPRQRIAFDGDQVDKPFTQIAPDEVYKVSPESLAYRKELQADLDYITQSRDIVELSKARALGKGMDQLEALIAANGPLVKDMSRGMEKAVCCLAHQIKYLVLQYMDTSRLIPYINEAGANSIFDYDPSSIVPSHLPGEMTHAPSDGRPVPSPTTRVKRARWWAQGTVFTLTPHSIHEIHQITYRLMLMQMQMRGYPIAQCDIMLANDIPDVKVAAGSTTQERYYAEKEEMMEQMKKLQQIAGGLGIDIGALMGAGGGKKPEGRQASGQQPPQQKMKGDGRPTISESG